MDREQIYKPHLTVGRFENSDACKAAVNKLEYFDYKLETKVSKIMAEIILDDLSSQIEMSLGL